jgi:hypothetical protein
MEIDIKDNLEMIYFGEREGCLIKVELILKLVYGKEVFLFPNYNEKIYCPINYSIIDI